jgi:diadenosine tetraphosphatase ApaH/serine/threonine PP2A family protein phosphatase
LLDLFDELQLQPEDRLVSVGDLVAKGPDNRKVLDFFQKRSNSAAILGNHECILLRHYHGEAVDLETAHVKVIQELAADFDFYMDWISEFPRYINLGSQIVVHAGIRPGRPLEEQALEDLTELRTLDGPERGSRVGTPWFEKYQGDAVVVFGHWVFETPLIRKNAIGIDTGCVYGGKLTAVVLPEERLVSVPARSAYARKKE